MRHDPADEVRYRILLLIEEDPAISQRDLAAKLGISLGKANFCLKALIDKGVIKAKASFTIEALRRAA